MSDEDVTTKKVLAVFGRNLVELRTARNWTTTELARRSGLGVETIDAFEGARESAPLDALRQLAGAFEVPMSTLVALAEHEPDREP